VAKSPKKQSEEVRFLLILHSKYSVMLSKYTRTDCFFGDFAHWDTDVVTTSEQHCFNVRCPIGDLDWNGRNS